MNYFSGVVGGNYSGSSQTVRKSCKCDICTRISAAGAGLALFVPAVCETCLALEGDRDFGGQQPPAEGKPENPAVLEGAECSFGHFVRDFTFWAFFCAVLATVVINELDFWNLWEQENGEVAFCSFWFSVSSEKKTFYCLISVSMSTWKVKYSYMKARPVVRGWSQVWVEGITVRICFQGETFPLRFSSSASSTAVCFYFMHSPLEMCLSNLSTAALRNKDCTSSSCSCFL